LHRREPGIVAPRAFGSSPGAWAAPHLATGKLRRQDWLLYVPAALFLARFIYLGAS
jgi:hypothetical protein